MADVQEEERSRQGEEMPHQPEEKSFQPEEKPLQGGEKLLQPGEKPHQPGEKPLQGGEKGLSAVKKAVSEGETVGTARKKVGAEAFGIDAGLRGTLLAWRWRASCASWSTSLFFHHEGPEEHEEEGTLRIRSLRFHGSVNL